MAYAQRRTEKRPVVTGVNLNLNREEADWLLELVASKGGEIAGAIAETLNSALKGN